MHNREEKIRVRAYEIWERQGHKGDPEDHWLEAERELREGETSTQPPQGASEATLEEAPPARAAEAVKATSDSLAQGRGSSGPLKGAP